MKKQLLFFFALAFAFCTVSAQNVFTVVFDTSDDGFLNVREIPSMKGKVLTKLWMLSHGLGNGVYLGENQRWTKVEVNGVIGWVYSKYVGKQTWYEGKGKPKLVAKSRITPIYRESMADDEDNPLFCTVKKGTIIADQFDQDDVYYILKTVHDFLFIKKEDAEIVK
jgi:hypothetical protein